MASSFADKSIEQELIDLTEDREPLDEPFSKAYTNPEGKFNHFFPMISVMQAISSLATFLIENDFKVVTAPFLMREPPKRNNMVSNLKIYLQNKKGGEQCFFMQVVTMQKLKHDPFLIKDGVPELKLDRKKFYEIKDELKLLIQLPYFHITCQHSVHFRKDKTDALEVFHQLHVLEFQDFQLVNYSIPDIVKNLNQAYINLTRELHSEEYKEFVRSAGAAPVPGQV